MQMMRTRGGYSRRAALLTVLATTPVLGHAPAAAQDDSLSVDRAVFEAIVRETADSIPEVLLVDVRRVKHDVNLNGLDPDDLEDGGPTLHESRTSVLHRLGIGPADALEERRCLWSRGLQRDVPSGVSAVADSIAAVHEECRAQPAFAVLLVGRPRPLQDTAAAVRVRVLRFSTYAYGYWDYTLRRDSRGAWLITERRRYLNVMS
jgi:hypothetical protein